MAISNWTVDLRSELRTNTLNHFKSKNSKVSAAIPDDFPNRSILNLYLYPVMHECDRVGQPPLSFSAVDPSASELTHFANINFEWGTSITTVIDRFSDGIFTAIALRHLLRAAIDMDRGSDLPPHHRCTIIVKTFPNLARTSDETCFLPEVRVLLRLPKTLIQQICASARGAPLPAAVMADVESRCTKCRAWIPEVILRHVRPDLFEPPVASVKGKEKGGFLLSSLLSCILLLTTSFFQLSLPKVQYTMQWLHPRRSLNLLVSVHG